MVYDFPKIIERLEAWRKKDQEIDKHLKSFCNAICPSSYPIFFEDSATVGFIEGIKVINKDLADDLSYFLYEASGMDEAFITYKKKEYNAKDKDEFIKYLELIYN